MRKLLIVGVMVWAVAGFGAESVEERLAKMEAMLQGMQQQLTEKNREIAELKSEVRALSGGAGQPAGLLEQMTADLPSVERQPGKSRLTNDLGVRLAELSAIVNVAAGGSTEGDAVIDQLQGGAHDPKQRGFSFQQLELGISGAVDPFFDVQSNIVLVEDAIELEEAFATSTSLPAGLEFRAGYFLTEFGRINPSHPHTWDWLDQPVINSRIFGGEGQRNVGAQLAWQLPTPWYSEIQVSMQQASGAFMASFDGEGLAHAHGDEGHAHGDEDHAHEDEHEDEHAEGEDEHAEEDEEHAHAFEAEEGIGGRPLQALDDLSGLDDFVYTIRWKNGFELDNDIALQLGFSAIFGPNNTGKGADTSIYGMDFVVKHQPAGSGLRRPRWVWQTEFIKRDFEAAALTLEGDEPLETDDDFVFLADDLDDWGLYSQFSYTLAADWTVGVRAEYATGDGDSYEEGALISRDSDPFRNDRYRLSPLVLFHPSEFTKMRLQYNYDDADHLDKAAHSVWVGFEWLIGNHPAHQF